MPKLLCWFGVTPQARSIDLPPPGERSWLKPADLSGRYGPTTHRAQKSAMPDANTISDIQGLRKKKM